MHHWPAWMLPALTHTWTTIVSHSQSSALHLWLAGLLCAFMYIWSSHRQLTSSQVPMHVWLAWLLRALMHIWTTIVFHLQSSALHLWLTGLLCTFRYIRSSYGQLFSSQVPLHLWLAWLFRALMRCWTTIVLHPQSSVLHPWLAGLSCTFMDI
jgi:hypothetical protein